MGENSEIEWTDHTFSPWWGCTKISPACDNCYAESWAKRTGFSDLWSGNRRTFSPQHWNNPRRWNRQHDKFFAEHGHRQRVFCASMADVFDNDAPEGERSKLWQLIRETPNLDWLLLTKRIGNAKNMLPDDWGPYPHVWLGSTIANQEEADRDIPKLLTTPANIRFLSCEPLLGLIDLQLMTDAPLWAGDGPGARCRRTDRLGLHWVIIGGESGNRARPTIIGDIRMLKEQCEAANVPVFCKQLGSKPIDRLGNPYPISDRKGKDMDEWPRDLRVREFPRC